jgi:hypothetical protein
MCGSRFTLFCCLVQIDFPMHYFWTIHANAKYEVEVQLFP